MNEEKTSNNAGKVFELVEVPTQHEVMIQTPEGTLIDVQTGIVMLLNEMKEVKNLIG